MKFRITVAPEALPGCCYLCRGTSREFFIDTDMHIEFHGAVYFCSECIREIAQSVGYEVPERVKQLKERLSELESINVNLLIERDGLEKAIDGLSSARVAGRTSSVWDSPDDVPMESEGTEQGEEELGSREGETPESSDDEGMDLVSADASDPIGSFKLRI